MKKIFLGTASLLLAAMSFSQVKEGVITYERTVQLNIQIADDNPQVQQMIPRERKDRFELHFANNKSLWKPAEADNSQEEMAMEEGGARMVFRMAGMDDISFHSFGESKKVDQRELGGKTYIITDSIRKNTNWKVAGETKTILGYKCMKATTQRTQESMRMQMENGQASRQRVIDTMNIVAWFTTEIPGSYGPDTYQGQLPGTILEIDVNNGRTSFKAANIVTKVDVASIKEPSKGKKLTQEEFAKEREKLFQEMMENGGGGRRFNIRAN